MVDCKPGRVAVSDNAKEIAGMLNKLSLVRSSVHKVLMDNSTASQSWRHPSMPTMVLGDEVGTTFINIGEEMWVEP